jgi:hypothetical protein
MCFSLISIAKRIDVAGKRQLRPEERTDPSAADGRPPYHAPHELANELFVLFVADVSRAEIAAFSMI